MQTFYTSAAIMDEIAYLDVGIVYPKPFFTFVLEGLGLSYQDDFNANYKIAGFSVMRNLHYTVITRTTYDILNCIGDIGGLESVLLIIGSMLISKFSNFASVAFFMRHIFYTTSPSFNRKKTSIDFHEGRYGGDKKITREGILSGQDFSGAQAGELKNDLKNYFHMQQTIAMPSLLRLLFTCCPAQRKKYKNYVRKHARAST